MSKPTPKRPHKHLRVSDAHAALQLATQAAVGVTRIAEGVHRSVLDGLGVQGSKAPGRTRGITGLVYKSIVGVTELLGKGASTLLARILPLLARADDQASSPEREAVLAVLNGVMGDRLAESGNAFATPMTLRYRGQALDWKAPPPASQTSGKVLLLIHGLCMNDLQWHANKRGQATDHAEALAVALGYAPVFVRYNSGLHISQNARELAAQLEQLFAHWPVPVSEISVIAHSMGGLVMRGACHVAEQNGLRWRQALKNIVFLGTPHHGAPLERGGNWVDVALGSTPYSAPFAKLGQLRSAGITDLRYGFVVDDDWRGRDRFRRTPDRRTIVPLPEGVACYTVAATLAGKRGTLADRLVGDGLVPLRSALGQHDDPSRTLVFPKASQWIAFRMSHLDLLNHPAVTQQLLRWLS